ncbi:MAG: alpha-2-macroglobulin family protein [Armatimonadota bacterium]
MTRRVKIICASIFCCITALTAVFLMGANSSGAGLPKLETRVFGQSQLLAGSRASIRIIVIDHMTGKPVKGVSVKGILRQSNDADKAKDKKSGKQIDLFSGRTDKDGTLSASFKAPDVENASYDLIIASSGLGENDLITKSIRVSRDQQVLLSTDKPLYQPGQIIHIRALALKRPDMDAVSKTPLTIEVDDAKGNKVFKKTQPTSDFGVASADFQLADEINMGRYTVRAIVGKTVTDKKVTVERYVLPKFKIKFTSDKTFYLPNESVKGTVQADYFFGKPAADAKVIIKAATFDFQFKDFAEITGRTDASGNFKFDQPLPSYFVGQPLEQGNAFVKFEVAITDGADHQEKITQTVPVASQSRKIIAVPEAGRIIPNIENTIYVMTTSPDGSPIASELLIQPAGMESIAAKTDASGIGQFKITPKNTYLDLTISASKSLASSAEKPSTITVNLRGSAQEDAVMMHIDKALAKVGETVNISVMSPSPSGTVYFDIIRAGQTLNTRAVDLKKGKAEITVPLSADMSGSLEVHAYRISRSGQIVRDTRLLYVNPADDLSVMISPDQDSFLPGKPAKIAFDVRDTKGKGVAAALGVSIVDESVFALQEMQPGMEKIYFLLEKELMEPKFEVHGLTPGDIVMPMEKTGFEPRKQQAARVLFALAQQDREQSGRITSYSLTANSYTDKYLKMREELGKQVKTDYIKISKAVISYYDLYKNLSLRERGGIHHLVQVGLLKKGDLLDQWGREYDFAPCGCGNYLHSLIVTSLGPDSKKNTDDDIAVGGTPSSPEQAYFLEPTDRMMDFAKADQFGGGMFGGFGGGGRGAQGPAGPMDALAMEVPAPAAMPGMPGGAVFKREQSQMESSAMAEVDRSAPTKQDVRVRQFFPETMYFNPSVITDGSGKATISLDAADSITTWRVSAMASSKVGQLGSNSEGMKVFQDFFIDIDLPVSLTQNDEVSIPVAIYNYLPSAQTVTLELTTEPWFELTDSATKKIEIGENDVEGIYYRIKVKEIGNHKLTVHAMGSKMSDAISRQIEVMPDGKEYLASINDRLEKTVEKTMVIPEDAIDGASNILVKVYPGIFSQVVEGMDKILQMPFGCFEQTSSTTYPNILVLDYMKSTNQITPETRMKAEQYINLGYQRLVTFEVPGGGFSWFGDPPANKILTAYGVMEFADMAKVYEVDQNLISRTQQWLIAQRENDGSWSPDKNYLHEESWGKIQKSNLLPTAWITWSLIHSGYPASELQPSINYLKKNAVDVKDPYTLAMICNALIASKDEKKSDIDQPTMDAIERLLDMKVEEDGKVYWKSDVSTITFTRGESADVETTALATLALIKSGRFQDVVTKALTYIIQAKDPNGTWGSTQATVWSLKALLMSLQNKTQDINAKVTVVVNGREAGKFTITPEDSDVLRQIDCKQFVKEGANTIRIEFDGKGSSLYQITGKYYLPWDKIKEPAGGKLISIDVNYDRTQLEKDDILTSTVKVLYNKPGTADMVMVDLGTPPGFQVMAEDFEALLDKKVIQKYTVTGRQVILYFDKLESKTPVEFKYRLKAKFPIKARTPKSTAYLYYNPEINDVAPPVDILVK